MPVVRFVGWHEGFQAVEFCKLLMASAGWQLKEAKEAADCLLEGIPVQVAVHTAEGAGTLLTVGRRLGAKGELLLAP